MRLKFASASHKPGYAEYLKCEAILLGPERPTERIDKHSNSWYDEESDHSNKAVRKTPEIESGHKVSEEVKWT